MSTPPKGGSRTGDDEDTIRTGRPTTGKYNTTKHDVPTENFKNPVKEDAYKKATPEEQKKLDEECQREMEKLHGQKKSVIGSRRGRKEKDHVSDGNFITPRTPEGPRHAQVDLIKAMKEWYAHRAGNSAAIEEKKRAFEHELLIKLVLRFIGKGNTPGPGQMEKLRKLEFPEMTANEFASMIYQIDDSAFGWHLEKEFVTTFPAGRAWCWAGGRKGSCRGDYYPPFTDFNPVVKPVLPPKMTPAEIAEMVKQVDAKSKSK
jgi:hypothetical protein